MANQEPEPGSLEPRAALQSLDTALRAATQALKSGPPPSPAKALEAYAAAETALRQVPALLTALEPVARRGDPPETARTEVDRHRQQLAELEQRTAPLRQQLTELLESADRLRAAAGQREELEQRVAELRRTEQLATRVQELRAQAAWLEERTRSYAGVVNGAQADLDQAAHDLITVGGELLATLTTATKDQLTQAQEQDSRIREQLAARRQTAQRAEEQARQLMDELAEAEHAATEATARFEELRGTVTARLAGLRRYAAADRDISQALMPPEDQEPGRPGGADGNVMAVLDQAEEQLAKADDTLARLLAEQQRKRETAMAPHPLAQGGPRPAIDEGEKT